MPLNSSVDATTSLPERPQVRHGRGARSRRPRAAPRGLRAAASSSGSTVCAADPVAADLGVWVERRFGQAVGERRRSCACAPARPPRSRARGWRRRGPRRVVGSVVACRPERSARAVAREPVEGQVARVDGPDERLVELGRGADVGHEALDRGVLADVPESVRALVGVGRRRVAHAGEASPRPPLDSTRARNDLRGREPEGRRRQDDDRRQPRRLPRRGGRAGAARRPRPAGERDLRARRAGERRLEHDLLDGAPVAELAQADALREPRPRPGEARARRRRGRALAARRTASATSPSSLAGARDRYASSSSTARRPSARSRSTRSPRPTA